MKPLTLLTLLILGACGGGGGGSGGTSTNSGASTDGGSGDDTSSSEDQSTAPKIIIYGAKESYWQDEPIRVTFDVEGMETDSLSFSAENLPSNFNFDTNTGVLETLPNALLPIGRNSLVIKAADGAGNSASSSFVFTANKIVSGKYFLSEKHSLSQDRAFRTKFFPAFSFPEGTGIVGSQYNDAAELHLARDGTLLYYHVGAGIVELCLGTFEISGEDWTATVECPSDHHVSNDGEYGWYSELAKVVIDSKAPAVNFLAPSGAIIEQWAEPELGDLISRNNDWHQQRWVSDRDLSGRYAIYEFGLRNVHEWPYGITRSLCSPLTDETCPTYKIDESLTIVSNDQDNCSLNGAFNDESVAEYQWSLDGLPNAESLLNSSERIMTATLSSFVCSGLDRTGFSVGGQIRDSDGSRLSSSQIQEIAFINNENTLFEPYYWAGTYYQDIFGSGYIDGQLTTWYALAVKVCDGLGAEVLSKIQGYCDS